MLGAGMLGRNAQAATLIGIVLVEAMVLCVRYGTLIVALGPTVREAIGGE